MTSKLGGSGFVGIPWFSLCKNLAFYREFDHKSVNHKSGFGSPSFLILGGVNLFVKVVLVKDVAQELSKTKLGGNGNGNSGMLLMEENPASVDMVNIIKITIKCLRGGFMMVKVVFSVFEASTVYIFGT